MSATTARKALEIWLATLVAIAAVALLIALTGAAGQTRALLAFSFPRREEWQDVAVVLWRNGGLAIAALTLARAHVGLLALVGAWVINVTLVGAALGAYGTQLVAHAGIYGAIELTGFSVVLATCLRIRRDGGRPEGGELLVALALLVMAALLETVLPWRL